MATLKANQPIGIFDSGIGGLTVARAIVDQLPNESIIYFGDTAHLPYGDKSAQAIQSYAKKIIDFLLSRDVKLILIACNSASAAAYEMLKSYVGDRAVLLNVIDPVVSFLGENYAAKRVGLIGTKLTVQSKIYHQKIANLARQIDFRALATPLLVPIIEEGFFEHELIDVALNEYLAHSSLQNIEALVLGCTHYPVIKKSIANFYKNKVDIIDAAKIVANAVKTELTSREILSSIRPNRHFYVSDYTEGFAKGTRLFFGEEIKVERTNIF
ncbi:MAG: glutamate racemase [uncultured bacterium]|nr:MAG: glutamate racemase [uncultured bacterium]